MNKKLIILSLLTTLLNAQFLQSSTLDQCNSYAYLTPDIFYVQGNAEYNAEPTKVTIGFGILIKDKSADLALSRTSTISEQVINSLKNNNVEVKIQTTNFKLSPIVDYLQDRENPWKGYQVVNQITVETQNLTEVGKLIDIAVKQGVNSVDYVNYDIESQSKKQIQDLLIDSAIVDAQRKAILVLQTLGMRIKSIKSVNQNDNNQQNLVFSQGVQVGFVIEEAKEL